GEERATPRADLLSPNPCPLSPDPCRRELRLVRISLEVFAVDQAMPMIADVLARVPLLLALASMSCAQSASRDVEVAIERHALALSSELPQQVHATLARIDGLPRQLLALRAYLRADDRLAAR